MASDSRRQIGTNQVELAGAELTSMKRQPKLNPPRSSRRRKTLVRTAAATGALLQACHSAHAATFNWTTGDTTGSWSSTSLSTDWKSATYPNAAGAIVTITQANAGNDAVTLNVDATAGEVINGAVTTGGAHWNVLYDGSNYHTLTLDGTGLGTNVFGDAGVAAIRMSASINTSVLNANISMFNTDLDIGAAYSTAGTSNLAIGTLGSTTLNNAGSTGNASAAHNLTFRGIESAGNGVTLNSDIGTSGANIAISDIYDLGRVTLNGNLGASVSSVTLNSTTDASTLVLAGANSYTGTTNILFGTVSIAADNNLGASSAAVSLNGGTLKTTAFVTDSHAVTIGASGGTIDVTTTGQYFFNTSNTLLGSGTLTLTGTGTLTANTGNFRVAQTNTFSGNITLQSGGIFEYGVAGAVGAGGTITIANQGELAVQGSAGVALPNAITVSGGTNSVLSFENGNGGNFSGPITLNTNAIIGLRDWYNYADVRSGVISGAISGSGGLTINSGTGTGGVLTLTGANSFTGAVSVSGSSVSVAGIGNSASNSNLGTNGTINLGATTAAGTLLYTGIGETSNKVINLCGHHRWRSHRRFRHGSAQVQQRPDSGHRRGQDAHSPRVCCRNG